ncbi:MAG: hypothetical protein ACYCT1_08390 [Steroidobacteraceae bacterium]
MSTALTSGFLKRVTASPSVFPDAVGPVDLVAGGAPTDLFNYQKFKSSGRVLRARDLQFLAPTVTGVNLLPAADTWTGKPVDMLAASQIDPHRSAWGDAWRLQATDTLRLQVQDTPTGPATFDPWATWSVEVSKPTLAERLRWPLQFSALTPAEQDLWSRLGKNANGSNRLLLPRTLGWILENEIRNNITAAYPVAATADVSDTSPLVFLQENVGQGSLLCIAGLALSAGSGSDGLTLQLGVDEEDDFYTIQAYGLGSGTPPFTLIWAKQGVTGTITATSAVNNVQASAMIWRVQLTEELAVRVGEVGSGDVYDRITAGVV